MATIDVSQEPVTLVCTPVPGPKGDPGPAGMGASIPGGRLTLVSGQPEMPPNADYSSTTLFYAPFQSDQVPVFDGIAWCAHTFTCDDLDAVGLSMVGGAKWAANTKRDVFATLVNGVLDICTGPAWAGDGLAVRGLVRRNGLWVNAAAFTGDISATDTVSVEANQATWLGSINIGATAGTLAATFTLGQNRRCDVWNAYHQKEILLGVGCPPANGNLVVFKPSSQYPAWQAFNNDQNNSGYYFTGMPQNVEVRYIQRGFIDSLNYGHCAAFAVICKDAISNAKGSWGAFSSDTSNDAFGFSAQAVMCDRGSIGSHRVFMGAANANNSNGASLWGMATGTGRYLEDTQTMWISYLG